MYSETLSCLEDLLDFVRRNHGWYRGTSFHEYKLLPSVKRPPYTQISEGEQFLVTDFIIEASQRLRKEDIPSDNSGWIALMQHHRLPTRLLDWSKSPFVAAYFAVSSDRDQEKDAAIWCLDAGVLNEKQGYGRYLYPITYYRPMELIEPAFKSYRESPDQIIACHSIFNNPRMYVQQSTFTIHGSNTPLDELPYATEILTKAIIPHDKKMEILDDLDACGFNQMTLFPDSDNISKYINDRLIRRYGH